MTIFSYITKDEYLNKFNMPEIQGKDVSDSDYKRIISLSSQKINWLTGDLIGTQIENIKKPYLNDKGASYTTDEVREVVKYATALLAKIYSDQGMSWLRGSGSISGQGQSQSQSHPDEPDYIPDTITNLLESVGLFIRQGFSNLDNLNDSKTIIKPSDETLKNIFDNTNAIIELDREKPSKSEVILTDGSTRFEKGYVPVEDKDPTTKEFVDSMNASQDQVINNIDTRVGALEANPAGQVLSGYKTWNGILKGTSVSKTEATFDLSTLVDTDNQPFTFGDGRNFYFMIENTSTKLEKQIPIYINGTTENYGDWNYLVSNKGIMTIERNADSTSTTDPIVFKIKQVLEANFIKSTDLVSQAELTLKQDKTDNALQTSNKTIVEAINEVKHNQDGIKATKLIKETVGYVGDDSNNPLKANTDITVPSVIVIDTTKPDNYSLALDGVKLLQKGNGVDDEDAQYEILSPTQIRILKDLEIENGIKAYLTHDFSDNTYSPANSEKANTSLDNLDDKGKALVNDEGVIDDSGTKPRSSNINSNDGTSKAGLVASDNSAGSGSGSTAEKDDLKALFGIIQGLGTGVSETNTTTGKVRTLAIFSKDITSTFATRKWTDADDDLKVKITSGGNTVHGRTVWKNNNIEVHFQEQFVNMVYKRMITYEFNTATAADKILMHTTRLNKGAMTETHEEITEFKLGGL